MHARRKEGFCGPKWKGGMEKWHNRRKRISRFKCSLRRHNSLNFLRISIFMILSCELINSERKSRWNWKSRKLISLSLDITLVLPFPLINRSHFSAATPSCAEISDDRFFASFATRFHVAIINNERDESKCTWTFHLGIFVCHLPTGIVFGFSLMYAGWYVEFLIGRKLLRIHVGWKFQCLEEKCLHKFFHNFWVDFLQRKVYRRRI